MSELTLLQLPLDILVNILGNLSYSDLRNVMLTCKVLKDLLLEENSIWRTASREKLIIHNNSDNSQSTNFCWYHKCRVSHNLCKGIYRSKILLYHQTNYMPWLKFHNSQVLFLSVGSELHCYPTDAKGFPFCRNVLWKLQIPTVKRNDVRTNDISRFVVKSGYIVCGNRDGCVAVYKQGNLKSRPHLITHIKDCHENGQVEVTAVELLNSYRTPFVITASESVPKLCFWSLSPESINMENKAANFYSTKCSNEINLGENVGIRCLNLHSTENKLALGLNGNSKPFVIDTTTGQVAFKSDSTKDIKQVVRDVRWHNNNTIMYVTHSGVLQLLDIRCGAVVFDVMDPFQSTLYCVKSDEHNAILVGSSEYSRCVLFDARHSAHHVQMYFTQKKSSPIYSLDFDATKLIAAADRSVAVLNFNCSATAVVLRDYSHTFEFCK